jgi:hypothetical protein
MPPRPRRFEYAHKPNAFRVSIVFNKKENERAMAEAYNEQMQILARASSTLDEDSLYGCLIGREGSIRRINTPH